MSRLAALMNDAPLAADARKKAEEIRAKLEPEYYDSAAPVLRLQPQCRRQSRSHGHHLSGRRLVDRPAGLAARGCDARPLGVARILRRLGHARYQQSHFVLRSHQLSPGLHLAAVHRLGLAGRVSRRTHALRLRAPDAECRTDLGAGSGRGDRIVVRRSVPAARPQQLAPGLVVRDGCYAGPARSVRPGLGRAASHAAAGAQPARRMGSARSSTMCRSEIRASSSTFDAAEGSPGGARAIGNAGSFLSGSASRAARSAVPASQPPRCRNWCCRSRLWSWAFRAELPLPGARTSQLKVVGERRTANRFELDFEAPGGAEYDLPVRINQPNMQSKGAELAGSKLRLRFPAGPGYQRVLVIFSW